MTCPYYLDEFHQCITGNYPLTIIHDEEINECICNDLENNIGCTYFPDDFDIIELNGCHQCSNCNEIISYYSMYCPICGEEQWINGKKRKMRLNKKDSAYCNEEQWSNDKEGKMKLNKKESALYNDLKNNTGCTFIPDDFDIIALKGCHQFSNSIEKTPYRRLYCPRFGKKQCSNGKEGEMRLNKKDSTYRKMRRQFPLIRLKDGNYKTIVKTLTEKDNYIELELVILIDLVKKSTKFKIFDTNKFITEFALVTGISITSIDEIIGKPMPIYVLDGKYSILPHIPALGYYNAIFHGLGSINLGSSRAAIYFKWQVENDVFYDFMMFSQDTIDKIDRKISDIARAFGITDTFMRSDLNNYIGKTSRLYIYKDYMWSSIFINNKEFTREFIIKAIKYA